MITGGGAGYKDSNYNPSVKSGKRALFNLNVARSFSDVVDGTSHSVAVSEIVTGPDGTADLRGMWWQDASCFFVCMYNPNSRGDSIFSSAYCNPSKVYCDSLAHDWGTMRYGASSLHPGGVNVGMADGSAAFVSDSINLAVWQALGSINGGGKNLEEMNPTF
jgi:prepilin-type processing-associated H-X9-DG protein